MGWKAAEKLIRHWKILRGDNVMIIRGKDKGESGLIKRAIRWQNRVIVEGKNLGRMDQKLNQAALVARRLSSDEETTPVVVCSDMARAVETAQMISAASDCDLVIVLALTEMHMGLFQGQTIEDVMRSEAYKAFQHGGRDQEIPVRWYGGESLNQLSDRIIPCLNAIAKKHKGERVVVVSHEAVIKEICRHADPTRSVPKKIPNTSISVVHISGSDGRWILEKVGDVEHLTGDGLPQSTSNL